ncbi:RNA-binding protein rnp-1 [Trichinella zimbabwensis]|uniref:RNA-binding protein rnp-1 n=3 Tax=Trichinella TaxID=6333 RepID=A0A0V1FMR3_TRIPS|nr:RNA-binding protein rnp-1 [Trichinella pseudospiralis]KRY87302.1 RNA-binding protein rnp-1 [Trichinella pseudospiralis]KRZ16556.1 RNA-binding protein rnp-1 [Trichinella zimbabwensis]
MVKFFVGNLASNVNSQVLRELFEKFGTVDECDVIRNFGFVHMSDKDEARAAYNNLNKFVLNDREIHLEYSTSKLRKEPGMDDVCFRCGASGHKTHNCPHHSDRGGGGRKRSSSKDSPYSSVSKRSNSDYGESSLRACQLPMPKDPLIPRPEDPMLMPLYDDYLSARERYHYYRDRLEREMYGSRHAGAPLPPPLPPPPMQSTMATVNDADLFATPRSGFMYYGYNAFPGQPTPMYNSFGGQTPSSIHQLSYSTQILRS